MFSDSFRPSGIGGNRCVLFEPLSLCYFLTAAQAEPSTPGEATQAVWPRVGQIPETELGFQGGLMLSIAQWKGKGTQS